jgi:hypothetical protein
MRTSFIPQRMVRVYLILEALPGGSLIRALSPTSRSQAGIELGSQMDVYLINLSARHHKVRLDRRQIYCLGSIQLKASCADVNQGILNY